MPTAPTPFCTQLTIASCDLIEQSKAFVIYLSKAIFNDTKRLIIQYDRCGNEYEYEYGYDTDNRYLMKTATAWRGIFLTAAVNER